ncbi:MAG: hypothetical protein H2172_01915 [Opitutus sp.]|nr:hypothetical protein [Opitutus sp.]MCS6248062.1 hypothetical protein [Opitutus sp.]MCS6275212.1 hypothetical protein [Opitutus sp.]MCS6278203.1 hypothetical protein [Opitutus sp.]MCS6299313.1 hypothetical protein [Opitutus sp.]
MHLARSNAIISIFADDDLTGKEGQFVRMSSNTAVALMDSGLDTPLGLLLIGGKTNERVTVAIPGGLAGTVRVKLAGEAYIGSRLQLTNDGRVMAHDNEFPRIIVGVALEAGVTGELIEASLCTATYTPAG